MLFTNNIFLIKLDFLTGMQSECSYIASLLLDKTLGYLRDFPILVGQQRTRKDMLGYDQLDKGM